ncbi:MAG: hypothetical protein WCP22_01370 [Chlamydiota bacterium]
MSARKKRPAVEWYRWARKPFLFAFYSLGAICFLGFEKIEAFLGGKIAPTRPAPLAEKLTVTFNSEGDKADLIIPFVPLFGGDSKWIKLKPEYVFRDLRQSGSTLKLTGHIYGRNTPEGPYKVAGIVFLSSQKEVAAFLRDLVKQGPPLTVGSVLEIRRTGAVPHAKGLLLKMAVGSRKTELAPARGGERLIGAGLEQTAAFLERGAEYKHLLISADAPDAARYLDAIDDRGKSGMRLSVYACLNLSLEVMVPIFLLEPQMEKMKMEDAALFLLELPEEEGPPPDLLEEPAPEEEVAAR